MGEAWKTELWKDLGIGFWRAYMCNAKRFEYDSEGDAETLKQGNNNQICVSQYHSSHRRRMNVGGGWAMKEDKSDYGIQVGEK